MKKLFISCPVAGRKMEDIRTTINKMQMIAEIVFDQEFEVINLSDCVYDVEGNVANETSVKMVAKRIEKLADADYFIGVKGWYDGRWRHCNIELEIARGHMNIPMYLIDEEIIAPDIEKIQREYYKAKHPVCDACTPVPYNE